MTRNFSPKNCCAWSFVLSIAVLLCVTPKVISAANPTTALHWQDLKEDALLAKQITLEAKHLPLGTLLEQASEQSGVNISLSPNTPLSQKLVTARISRMDLYDFMGAIGRTYNAFWSKAENGSFLLTPKDDSSVEEGISQIGNPVFFRYRDRLSPPDSLKMSGDNDIKTRNAIYQKVLLSVDQKALTSDKGVPLHLLPFALAEALQNQYKKANAVGLLLKYPAYKKISGDDLVRLTVKQDPALEDPHAWLNGNIPDPLYDKVITIEVLKPDKKTIQKGSLSWTILGKSVLSK